MRRSIATSLSVPLFLALFFTGAPVSRAAGPSRSPAGERLPEVDGSLPAAPRPSQAELPIGAPAEATPGLKLEGIYRGEVGRLFRGDADRRPHALGLLDLRFAADGERLAGLAGTQAYLSLMNTHGDKPTIRNLGDTHTLSNIETARPHTHVQEAWIQKSFGGDRWSLLLGIQDLNSEFYSTDAAALFLGGAFGVGAELAQSAPSTFPETMEAARVRFEPDAGWVFQAAGYGFEDTMVIAEAARVRGRGDPEAVYSKYAIGAWAFDGRPDQGAYALAEQGLCSTLALFVRYGRARATEEGMLDESLGSGIVWSGEADRVGLGLLTSRTREDATETVLETTYRHEFGSAFALQPDLQYVRHPGSDRERPSAWRGAIRIELRLN